MEDKIVAVCGHPELYDTTAYSDRDRTKKENAWRKVSEEIGLPEEVCRKKWKGLRDTYLKERRKECERKSGDTSSNMGRVVEEDRTTEYEEQVSDAAAGPSGIDIGVTRRTRKRTRGSDREREIEAFLLEALKRPAPPAPPPPSEDELFLKSLVHSLQRLSPQQKEFVKFQIHKLIYEPSSVVLNLEPAE
eukprot:superscaffoldBa00008193_g23155